MLAIFLCLEAQEICHIDIERAFRAEDSVCERYQGVCVCVCVAGLAGAEAGPALVRGALHLIL